MKLVPQIQSLFLICCAVIFQCTVSVAGDPFEETGLYTYKVARLFPHDPNAFTQGLVIDNGILYEGTGMYGESSLRRVDMQTGEIVQQHRLASSLFGEGITVVGNRIIQLTWRSQFGLVYDKNTFKLLRVFNYPGEGWGITYDGKHLIMSDGTATIRFLDPETFKEKRRIKVMDNQKPVALLNELEFVKGSIYANIWKSDRIAIIDPQTGSVDGWLDMSGILSGALDKGEKVDVLNGIAYDQSSDSLYITGKLWPKIFQVELVPQQNEH